MKYAIGPAALIAFVISACAVAPKNSEGGARGPASIPGLYNFTEGDRVSVAVNKDGHLVVKVETQKFPDLPQCTGFQVYRHEPHIPVDGNLKLTENPTTGQIGDGFALWYNETCAKALAENSADYAHKAMTQEIDVYTTYFDFFKNTKHMKAQFEKDAFVMAIGFQVNASRTQEFTFKYSDAKAGKVLKE